MDLKLVSNYHGIEVGWYKINNRFYDVHLFSCYMEYRIPMSIVETNQYLENCYFLLLKHKD